MAKFGDFGLAVALVGPQLGPLDDSSKLAAQIQVQSSSGFSSAKLNQVGSCARLPKAGNQFKNHLKVWNVVTRKW